MVGFQFKSSVFRGPSLLSNLWVGNNFLVENAFVTPASPTLPSLISTDCFRKIKYGTHTHTHTVFEIIWVFFVIFPLRIELFSLLDTYQLLHKDADCFTLQGAVLCWLADWNAKWCHLHDFQWVKFVWVDTLSCQDCPLGHCSRKFYKTLLSRPPKYFIL